MLKQRIISALIAIPIFAWVMLGAPLWAFNLAWFVIIGVTAFEWSKLMPISTIARYSFTSLSLLLPAFILIANGAAYVFAILFFAGIAWLFIVPILLKVYAKTGRIFGESWLIFLLGILFITGFSIAIVMLKDILHGWLLGILVLIWASDAGAYFIGKAIGKRKFSPNISPNKTWEGFIGGLLFALLLSVAFFFISPLKTFVCSSLSSCKDLFAVMPYWLFISLISLIYAGLGDLFQSMLKRNAGVKDSGKIMPGHGGAFDRIDSWIPGLTFWAIGIFPIIIIATMP